MSQLRYRAFISYSHRDEPWAAWLHKALETYRLPRGMRGRCGSFGLLPERLAPVFRDREELASASDLGRQVNAALAESEALVVVCSPQSAASRWVNEEVLAFKRLGRGERIFCLIVGGEPNASALPGREAEECFCPALRFALTEDGQLGTQPTEPIAADARPQGDGKAGARLKLIAGLLGIGLDDLRHREQQRQQRRMWLVTAGSTLVMAVTSTLAVLATTARDAAERRQRQADALVEFMIGDLYERMLEVNRIDIMQRVADEAMAHFSSLPPQDTSEQALFARATAIQKIGHIRKSQRLLQPALEAFGAALEITRDLSRRHPDSLEYRVGYADNLGRIGIIQWEMSKLDAAAASFEAAIAELQAADRQNPGALAVQRALLYQSTNAGRVYEASGDLDQAMRVYNDVLEAATRLHQAEPEAAKWKSEIGFAHNNLGKLASITGDLKSALQHFREEVATRIELADLAPEHKGFTTDLAWSRIFLGRLLLHTGKPEAAELVLTQSVLSLQHIASENPDDLFPRILLAVATRTRAEARLAQERQTEAMQDCASSEALLSAIVASRPDDSRTRLQLLDTLVTKAKIHLLAGVPEAASVLDELASGLKDVDPSTDRSRHARIGVMAVLYRRMLPASPDSASDRAWIEEAEAHLAHLEASRDPEITAARALLASLSGDANTANARAAALAQTGYFDPTTRMIMDASRSVGMR